ncbi:MAG: sugar-binding protein, partial [Verrucomicrobiota bacterium]
MHKRISALLPVLALCLVQPITRANDIEPTKEFYTVVYSPKPIVLDGDLSEWSGVPVLADPKFAIPKYSGTNASPNYVLFEEYDGGTWTGPDDQTSAVQIAYDADNVYFGFVVTDDYHENMSGNAWNGDSIQLMIASADRTAQVALYNYALGGYEDNQGNLVPDPNLPSQIMVDHQAGPGGDSACNCPTEAVIKRDFAKKKTTYEIKLPKGALGLTTLKGGPQFGLGMAINDGDGALVDGVQYGQAGQQGQKGWGGLGAHSIVFGKTSTETAQVTLAKGNDIEPGKEYYTALRTTNVIVLDGNLSEWTGAPVLADPKFAVPKFSGTNDSPNYVLFEQYDGGTWTGPDDQTSAVQVVYDADNVYFGFVVTDDYHENAANSAWNGDSIQLMIADATRTQQIALYNYALGGVEGALDVAVEANRHEAGPGGDEACNCATEVFVRRDGVNKKTYYEIKLPAASLGLTAPLTVGTQFGLGMAINDGDNGPGQAGQKGWGGLGAHSIVFGKTPTETALVTLGTTVSGSDRLFLSAINPGVASFSFRATDKGVSVVDSASAKLTINGKVVALTSKKTGDATDFSYSASTALALGVSHTYLIEVKDSIGNTVTDQGSFKVNPMKIGLNFASDEPTEADPPGSALLPDDVAGVPAVAQANWNNLSGTSTPTDPNDDTIAIPFAAKSDGGATTSVTVVWDSNNTWASAGKGEENNAFPAGPDHTLMTGYLDTDAATTSHLKIAGIPDALTGGGYDLYVYLLGGVPGKGGGYRVLDSAGGVLKDYVLADANANPTTYTEVPQNLAAGVHGVGNYIVFKGLKATAMTLEATTVAPQGSGTPARAPTGP